MTHFQVVQLISMSRIQEYKGIGERLRETDERLSAALEEIERLKTINSSRTFLYLEARSLITELCDALSESGYYAETG